MPAQIPMEVWALLAQWLVYGGSLAAAFMGIAKLFSYLRSKTTISKLEKEVKEHADMLDRDHKRLTALEMQARSVDADLKDMHVLMKLSVKAQQAMLRGMLDGNNKANIQHVSDELQDYLNDQI